MFIYKYNSVDPSDRSEVLEVGLDGLELSRDVFDLSTYSFSFSIPSTPTNDRIIRGVLDSSDPLGEVFVVHPFDDALRFSIVVDSYSHGVWSVNFTSIQKSLSDTFQDLTFRDYLDYYHQEAFLNFHERCQFPLESYPSYDNFISYVVSNVALTPYLRKQDRVPVITSTDQSLYSQCSSASLLSQSRLGDVVSDFNALNTGITLSAPSEFHDLNIAYKGMDLLVADSNLIDAKQGSFDYSNDKVNYTLQTGQTPFNVLTDDDPLTAMQTTEYAFTQYKTDSFKVFETSWYFIQFECNLGSSQFIEVQLCDQSAQDRINTWVLNKPNSTCFQQHYYQSGAEVYDTRVSIDPIRDEHSVVDRNNFLSYDIFPIQEGTYYKMYNSSDDILYSARKGVDDGFNLTHNPRIGGMIAPIDYSKVQFAGDSDNFQWFYNEQVAARVGTYINVNDKAKIREIDSTYNTIFQGVDYKHIDGTEEPTDWYEEPEELDTYAYLSKKSAVVMFPAFLEKDKIYEFRILWNADYRNNSWVSTNPGSITYKYSISAEPCKIPRFKSSITPKGTIVSKNVRSSLYTLKDYSVANFVKDYTSLFSYGFINNRQATAIKEFSPSVEILPEVKFDSTTIISQNDYDAKLADEEIKRSDKSYSIQPISTPFGEWEDDGVEYGDVSIQSLQPIKQGYRVEGTEITFPSKPAYFKPNLQHSVSGFRYALKGAQVSKEAPDGITHIGDRYARPDYVTIDDIQGSGLALGTARVKYRFNLISHIAGELLSCNCFRYLGSRYFITKIDQFNLVTGFAKVTAVKVVSEEDDGYLYDVNGNPLYDSADNRLDDSL